MGCERFEALWFKVGEGEATPAEAEEAARHRAACPRCHRLARGLEGIDHVLEGLGDRRPEPPPYLAARIRARVAEVPRPGRWRRLWARMPVLRPTATLAAVALAFFVGLLAREVHRLNAVLAQDTRTVVIEFADPEARDVRLVGDFNAWGRGRAPIRAERRDGRWVFRLKLEPGRYRYAFVVDGARWLPDPNATSMIPDGFGGANSVLDVGERVTEL